MTMPTLENSILSDQTNNSNKKVSPTVGLTFFILQMLELYLLRS